MKKRLLILFVTIVFTASSLFTTFANSEQSKTLPPNANSSILIDGNSIDTTDFPIYLDESSVAMYPLRLIAENLGANISWDNEKKSVLINYVNGEVVLIPSTKMVYINGVNKRINYNIENKNSSIYVPAEFIRDILTANFELNPTNQTISIQKPSKSLEALNLSDSEQLIQKKLATYLSSLELNRNFSGQILVETNGKVLIDRSYGYSDFENHVKSFNTTTFAIGSVTKQFTATAIAQLVEKNKLAFDDKVSKYLSDVPFGDKITLHQLLTHTSGLYNITSVSEVINLKPSEMTYTKLISLIKDQPLDFEPGTEWRYSNTGYIVLGAIIEKVSEQTLETYLEENIFKPVGMDHTGIAYRANEKLVTANGYTGYMDVVLDSFDEVLLNLAYGAGYLCSTAEDLYKWDLSLQAGKVVSPESLSKIFGKHGDTHEIGQYGYGWFSDTGAYGEEISHGGNTCGFTSLNALFPEKNAHIILLTNKGYVNLVTIKDSIINILNSNVVAPIEARGSYDIPISELENYAGSFEAENTKATIVNNSGALMLNLDGMTCRLIAESKEKLYSRDIDVELKYIFNTSREITGIHLRLYGSNSDYKKTKGSNYITISETQLEKYVGTYEIKELLQFVVTIKDGKLIFKVEGQPEVEVTPLSETEFESLLYGVKIKFDNIDTPKGCTINQAGLQFNATKLK
ncbi:MAG: hypothetical protein CVV02_02725 [Firmicutes bacterium HGW-Firmicutes-7]|nr:MAG: hypothetical protein CVV02_02725 [Firmicutes bacterium HGW-Firmicutes-7]